MIRFRHYCDESTAGSDAVSLRVCHACNANGMGTIEELQSQQLLMVHLPIRLLRWQCDTMRVESRILIRTATDGDT